jgi:hypothetical protein
MTWGFLMIKPSLTNLRMFLPIQHQRQQQISEEEEKRRKKKKEFLRELALEISEVSLGSSQIFLLPQLRTLAASLF